MTFWFFILGLPVLALGLFLALAPARAGRFLVAFPRNVLAGRILCAVGWLWTARACDQLGIDVFDKFLKAFPGELWILAVVLTILTCWWMENLLPIRGVSAVFMLFPGEMFPMIRLCDTSARLALVVFAYVCAVIGMFGMFYPWWIRKGLAWMSERPSAVRGSGAALASVGALFTVLGALAATGMLK
ncbi:MAG: hypothetical protein PUE68_11425 [Kiritimatiellae bacterium]|nr:hypothetical protein [Kiritimatiellia bacterium]